ncbi:MAG: PocR ligand-binding domain-containing protein [Desulfovibrionaceae bacterium]
MTPTPTDLLPAARWEELEREVAERFGLSASVTDNQGARVTTFDNFCNDLCRRIKTDPKGLTAICALAGQYFAGEVASSGGPVMEECDAGMTKIAVPIYVGGSRGGNAGGNARGEVAGNVGGCGVLVDDGEPDDFMIAKSLGVDEAELAGCMATVPRITRARAEEIRAWLEERVARMLAEG